MNILLISENFYPETNAPGRRLYEHSKEWVKLGYNVTVLTGVPNSPNGKVFKGYKNKIYQIENIDGIEIIRVWTFIAKNEGFIFRTIDFISFMLSSFVCGIFLKKYDRIIVSSPQFLPAISGFIIAKLKKIPFILEIRDLWPESIVALGVIRENNIIIKILYATAKYIYKKSELIVVVTKTFKKHLIKYGVNKDKILIIENGFNFERALKPNEDANIVKKKYNIKNNRFTVSYIGTIGKSHGIEIMLETAKLVKDINFLIIGDGAQKKTLVKNAKDRKIQNVIFIDNICWQEIVNINQIISANIIHLRKLELFKTVIPSKLFESMALQKPILAGLIGESLEIIKKSNSGLQFIPENASSLATEVLKLKNDPKLRNELAMNGALTVNKKYNRKVLASKMIKEIEKL